MNCTKYICCILFKRNQIYQAIIDSALGYHVLVLTLKKMNVRFFFKFLRLMEIAHIFSVPRKEIQTATQIFVNHSLRLVSKKDQNLTHNIHQEPRLGQVAYSQIIRVQARGLAKQPRRVRPTATVPLCSAQAGAPSRRPGGQVTFLRVSV